MPAGCHDNHAKGASHPMAKLTEKDAQTIRSSSESNPTLAARYGIHTCTVWNIRTRRNWKCLDQEKGQPSQQ
jgi:hypothetical protein